MKLYRLAQTISFICACLLPASLFAGAAFAVAPDRTNIDLSKTNTIVFIVKNTGDQLIHLRIHPEFLPLGKTNKDINAGTSDLSKADELKTSLVPYTIVSPEALSLQPTERREVRVSVRTPHDLKPGSYRAHLAVRMLEFVNQQRYQKNHNGKEIGLQLNLLMQIAPVIYGDLGENQAHLNVTCSVNKNGMLVLHAINKTPWHFSGKFQIYNPNSTAKPIYSLMDPVFRNSHRDIVTQWKATRSSILVEWRNDQNAQAPIGQTTCHLNQ